MNPFQFTALYIKQRINAFMILFLVILAVIFYHFNLFNSHGKPELLGIIFSPLFTIFTLVWVEEYKAKWNSKYEAFKNLYANRGSYLSEEFISYFNMIDILFINDKKVRECWQELFDILMVRQDYPNRENDRKIKNIELLEAMALSLGLNKDLTISDIGRSYTPRGLCQGKEEAFIQYCNAGIKFFDPESVKKVPTSDKNQG